MRVFQNWMLSGSPSRSRGPGNNSRKKSASWASKDRNPLGTILMGWLSEVGVDPIFAGEPEGLEPPAVDEGSMTGVADGVEAAIPPGTDGGWAVCSARKCRRSSARSFAVE